MLDQVLIAQATLQTLRLLTNLSLISVALVAIGAGGWAMTRGRAGGFAAAVRVVSKMTVGLGALGIAGLLALIAAMWWPRSPERFEWTVDLRTARPLEPFRSESCATWAVGARSYINCIYEGQTRLDVQFPGGRSHVQTGRALWAAGLGDRLNSLHHFLEPMTLADVRTTVEPLIDPWRLRRADYDDWLTRAATEERAWYLTPADEDRAEPWLELSVRPLDTPRRGERAFAVSVKWHWQE
jgi:hypothetical protein